MACWQAAFPRPARANSLLLVTAGLAGEMGRRIAARRTASRSEDSAIGKRSGRAVTGYLELVLVAPIRKRHTTGAQVPRIPFCGS